MSPIHRSATGASTAAVGVIPDFARSPTRRSPSAQPGWRAGATATGSWRGHPFGCRPASSSTPITCCDVGVRVPDSLIIDVAIGLVFTFAVFAALTSALTEAVSRFVGLRGDYLLRGLRALIDGEATPASVPGPAERGNGPHVALWGALGGDGAGRKEAGGRAQAPTGDVLVIGANVSAIALSRSLYSDQAMRETIVTQAVASSNCSSKDAATCIDQARQAVAKLHAGGLPIGWGAIAECRAKGSSCSWLQRYGLT